MKGNLSSLLPYLIRSVVSISLILLGFYLIYKLEEGFSSMTQILIAMACFIAGALVIASPIASLLSKPSGSLYFPPKKAEIVPMYSVAESLVKRGLYREAIQEYWRISERHPEEIKPYVDMIKISVHHLKDFELATDIWSKGLSVFKGKHEEKVISGLFSEIESTSKDKHILDSFDNALKSFENKS